MKRYIKSAIAEYKTLKDWIDENKSILDNNTRITIFDKQPYPHSDEEEVPGIIFAGTFYELITGTGKDNYFIPDDPDVSYALSDYLDAFDDYELIKVTELPKNLRASGRYYCEYDLTVLHNWTW